jgi:hypothetical protein
MPPVLVISLVLSPAIYITGCWLTGAARTVTLAALVALWLTFGLAMRDVVTTGALIYVQGALSFYFDGLSLLITSAVLVSAHW